MFQSFYFDWTFLLIIPGIIIAIWAQTKISKAYNMYSKMHVDSGITGRQTAELILSTGGVNDVRILAASGKLTDNYNPRKRTVNLSQNNFSGSNVAAVAVAAHESGHAIQHHERYFPLTIRSLMAPVVSAASYLLWPLLLLGIFLGFTQTISIVVYIFLAIFLFQLITLPVEYNASKRALAALEQQNVLTDEELYGAKKMLNAAALTYVAATLVALLNVIRFAAMSRRR